MFLSPEAIRYKRLTTKLLLEKCTGGLLGLSAEAVYSLTLVFHIQATNKGYPNTAEKRFKKVDLSNRIKLLEDVLKEVTQIDDSQTFMITVVKNQVEEGQEPYVELFYEPMDEVDWQPQPARR